MLAAAAHCTCCPRCNRPPLQAPPAHLDQQCREQHCSAGRCIADGAPGNPCFQQDDVCASAGQGSVGLREGWPGRNVCFGFAGLQCQFIRPLLVLIPLTLQTSPALQMPHQPSQAPHHPHPYNTHPHAPSCLSPDRLWWRYIFIGGSPRSPAPASWHSPRNVCPASAHISKNLAQADMPGIAAGQVERGQQGVMVGGEPQGQDRQGRIGSQRLKVHTWLCCDDTTCITHAGQQGVGCAARRHSCGVTYMPAAHSRYAACTSAPQPIQPPPPPHPAHPGTGR